MQGDSPKFKATRQFWKYYNSLPTSIQQLADEKYALLRRDPRHPSLRLKTGRRIPLPFSPAYQIYTDYSDCADNPSNIPRKAHQTCAKTSYPENPGSDKKCNILSPHCKHIAH